MNIKKGLFAGIASLALSMSAQASTINVGGVTWDPAAGSDFIASSSFFVTQEVDFSNPVAQQTSGLGRIGEINGSMNVCNSCDLLFSYSYTYDPTLSTGGFGDVAFRDGKIEFYVVDSGIYSGLSAGGYTVADNATVATGDLWLELEGRDLDSVNGSIGAGVDLISSYAPFSDTYTFTAAFLDVVNNPLALATGNFIDQNSREIAGSGQFADFQLAGAVFAGDAKGSTSFIADSIPEPTTLALLGLGLLGFAGSRKKSK